MNSEFSLYPSLNPLFSGFPQIVITFPFDSIFLIIWLSVSVINKLSLESIVIPYGLLNLASDPFPSLNPFSFCFPTNIDTLSFETFLITWFCVFSK